MAAPDAQKVSAQVDAFINTASLPEGYEEIRTRELREAGVLDFDSRTLLRMHTILLQFQQEQRNKNR